jgi:hypothetical protein
MPTSTALTRPSSGTMTSLQTLTGMKAHSSQAMKSALIPRRLFLRWKRYQQKRNISKGVSLSQGVLACVFQRERKKKLASESTLLSHFNFFLVRKALARQSLTQKTWQPTDGSLSLAALADKHPLS